jgi:hypothetical protein
MKAHHFFAVGLSLKADREYDADHDGFERRHGITHAELVQKHWEALGFVPGPSIMMGMKTKRAEWRSGVDGCLSDYDATNMSTRNATTKSETAVILIHQHRRRFAKMTSAILRNVIIRKIIP